MPALERGIVLWARRQSHAGARVSDLAKELGVEYETLLRAVNGATWSYLDHIVPPVRKGYELGRKGEDHGGATLTEEQVIAARRRAHAGEVRGRIARDLGVSVDVIRAAIIGKSWSHLNEVAPPAPNGGPGGSNKGNQRLTENDVRQIRRRSGTEPPKALAQEFGVTPNTVSSIVRHKTWRNVE
jgi:hypothetical protein